MKTVSQIQETIKAERENSSNRLNEANKYLTFASKYYKDHGVSGPFDAKFKKDKKAQEKFMAGLSKAWEEHKKKSGK